MKNFSGKLLVIALGAVLATASVFCAGAAADGAEHKDTIVWGQGADVTSFDPHQGKETPAVTVTCQIFDTLTAVDPATGEVKPQIAESWEQLDDTTYVFHIRKGIKFHNGSELTAADVKFSLDRAIASASVSYIVDFIKEVNVKDDFTVQVVLRAPYAPALRNLAVPFAAIVCKDVVEKDEEAFKLRPIGSGPYKFVEWKPGDTVKLDAFDDYMDGKPATPHLVMKVVPETSQRLIALETGDLDISYDLGVNDVKRGRDNKDLVILEAPSLSCWYISMNMNKKPFDDPRVREAINYAIDRQLIVDTIMSGNGQAADAIIAPSVFGYYPSGVYDTIRKRPRRSSRTRDMKKASKPIFGSTTISPESRSARQSRPCFWISASTAPSRSWSSVRSFRRPRPGNTTWASSAGRLLPATPITPITRLNIPANRALPATARSSTIPRWTSWSKAAEAFPILSRERLFTKTSRCC